MKAKRPEWVWERFRALYLGGVSYPLMAEHTGVPAGTLRVWRIKMGLPSRKFCRAKVTESACRGGTLLKSKKNNRALSRV